jgi:hypothetical protein
MGQGRQGDRGETGLKRTKVHLTFGRTDLNEIAANDGRFHFKKRQKGGWDATNAGRIAAFCFMTR